MIWFMCLFIKDIHLRFASELYIAVSYRGVPPGFPTSFSREVFLRIRSAFWTRLIPDSPAAFSLTGTRRFRYVLGKNTQEFAAARFLVRRIFGIFFS
ncbi:MAG: hypothetical protein LBG87_09760 [Spirochaetaceae bacterium]|nr:hypothetical protein [Spirochaetaceae bacterium]